ncbi:MAG: choice-of-anchor B family protein [Flavobacteriales bacterium]|nr:choice-of-anchor B family protein [Flavobacteriales bacterium]
MKRSVLFALMSVFTFGGINAQTLCETGFAGEFPCENVDMWAFLSLDELGGAANLNDIWGWEDIASGREFAVVCKSNGTAFVEVTDPANPIYLGSLPTHTQNSLWRDAKVFQNHAFIVSEAQDHGMQVFDLTQLLSVTDPPVDFTETAHYDGHGRAHNIVMNEETGYAYSVGTSSFDGGLFIIDVNDPVNPVIAGDFAEDGYTHDAQIVNYTGPDKDYCGREICFACNENTLTIVDVTDKEDCQLLAAEGYDDTGYSHQGWLTEDQRYFLLGDETDELSGLAENTRTLLWDVRDLDNPVLIDVYEGPTTSIDHNLYIRWEMAFQSNYRSGLRVLDVTDARQAELSEIAYFDVQPSDNNASFSGTWSNYPYFRSGTVVVTDMYAGLFILRPRIATIQGYVEVLSTEDEASLNAFVSYAAEEATVDYSGLPSGVTATVNNAVLPGPIQVDLAGLSSLAAGDYIFTMSVTHDGQTLEREVTITISEDTPLAVTALGPEDVTIQPFGIELSWESNVEGAEYFVEVADSDDFSTIVHSETTSETMVTIPFDLPDGDYFWRVTASGSCDTGAESDVTSFTVLFVSVEEQLANSIKAFPNPVTDQLIVLFDSPNGGTLTLTDSQGRIVHTENVTQSRLEINTSQLSTGVYTLQIDGIRAKKIIKK